VVARRYNGNGVGVLEQLADEMRTAVACANFCSARIAVIRLGRVVHRRAVIGHAFGEMMTMRITARIGLKHGGTLRMAIASAH
jgi:hypothetical protein